MIKKIQQYLLLNYPIIWNTKLIPTILIIAFINAVFFGIGYWISEIDFQATYYYNYGFNLGIGYFFAVVTAIITLIIWLVMYSRNNAFKVFYPKKSSHLYFEWLIVLVITSGIAIYPFALEQGSKCKIRTYATEAETLQAMQILNKINLLIPDSKSKYFSEYPNSQNQYVDDLDSLLQIKETKVYTNYPNFRRLSLLNRNQYRRMDIFYEYNHIRLSSTDDVKAWLIADKADSVQMLIADFIKLQTKHGLTGNIDAKTWFKLIYNSPTFPVGDFNLIKTNKEDYDYQYQSYAEEDIVVPAEVSPSTDDDILYTAKSVDNDGFVKYYVQYDELVSAYNKIQSAYFPYRGDNTIILLICACFGLGASILILSFRLTSGKSWLIAFVLTGVISLLCTLLVASLASIESELGILVFMLFWLILFVTLLCYLVSKTVNKGNKGRSKPVINLFMWLTPFMPFLIYGLITYIHHETCTVRYNSTYMECDQCNFFEKYLIYSIWINNAISLITMWFVIRLARKWKSLPEE